MLDSLKRKSIEINVTQVIDNIENAVCVAIKPFGFKKHGRTLHRFVDGDISQVINFQCGETYRNETHLMWVNIGIRVPECQTRSFSPDENINKYYHEYECNIRARLGEIRGQEATTYNLQESSDTVIPDIINQINDYVLPVFDKLSTRELVLQNRRNYPNFDTLNSHMILLEEAMIYGRLGDIQKAKECFNQYYDLFKNGNLSQKDQVAIKSHLDYLDKLAENLQLI